MTAPTTEQLVFGICDRLYDHGNCNVDVVLVPANETGEPDWDKADPANVEALPADEWPEDEQTARRACVIVSNIDGCDPDTTILVFLREDGNPSMLQIHGPAADRDIAMMIIGRDIGAAPAVDRSPSKLVESMENLREKLFPPKPEPKAANDNRPAVSWVSPTEWQDAPIPVREWWLPDLVPMRQVTLLSGDGGVGKSLLALQLACAGALQCETLGMRPLPGRVMYVGAEDAADEFHRRLADIVRAHHRQLSDLDDFALLPLADADALLAVPDRAGNMCATPLWAGIVEAARDFMPRLIVLDTAADLFGGDEIKRGQVRQFIAMLRKLAMEINAAIVLLAHPSVQGMQSGTGSSGSTAWSNSVRSRLYLTSDGDIRTLKTMKANYGKTGAEIKMRWSEGVFVLDDGLPSAEAGLLNRKADETFRELLSLFNRTNQNVSDVTGTNYAPAKMAKHPNAKGIGKKALADAMQRLLDSGEVRIVMDGPPSRQRKRLILASEDYGARGRAA